MKYRQFYEQWFSNLRPKESGECSVVCPFHKDSHPSLSINLKTGVWNCFSCGIGEGAPVFQMKMTNCSMAEALRAISRFTGDVPEEKILIKQTKTILKSEINKYHELLLKNPEIIERLLTKRGFNVAVIKDFKLGWSPKEQRLYIPILNKNKDLINIRKYSFDEKGAAKMLSYKAGYGSAVLFPISKLKYSSILLCEGEMDCILANAIGYHAISVTGGARTWKEEWNEFFAGKKVVICYDIDDSGQSGAQKVANNIADYAEEVKIIHLPLDSPKNADLTDFLIGHGESKKDLDTIIEKAIPFQKKLTPEEVLTKNVFDVHLSKASEAYYRNQIIRINVLVAGKDLAPYIVPLNIKAKCLAPGSGDKNETKKCKNCSMVDNGGILDISYELSEPGLLKFIANDEDQQMQLVRRKAGIPSKCGTVILKITESTNIEELTLIPELNFSATDQEYVVRKAYYAGHGAKPNSSYTMTGITIPEPRTQYATHLIYQMIPSQDNISTFKLTKEIKNQLKIFQSTDIETKFHEIVNDLSSNVTQIYGREDLHWAIDLVYHSALNFYFQDKLINKGWLECLILGDTRCITEDSIVFTENGIKPIINCSRNEIIATASGQGKISEFHFFKKEKTIKIKTHRGLILEGTFDHPVLTPSGYKELSQLKINDYVAVQVGSNLFGKNKISNEMARVLGYFIGDGYLNYRRRNFIIMTISMKELDVINDFENCLKILNIDFKKYKKQNCWSYWINRKYFNLPFCKSGNKEIPTEILSATKPGIIEFLRGLFETDGSHGLNGAIEYCSKSFNLIKQVQLLLLNLGILSTIREKIVNNVSYYRLGIFGNSVDVFFEEIGFISNRKNKRKGIIHKSTLDTIPEISHLIDNIWIEYKKLHPEIQKRNPKLNGFSINTIRQWRYGNRKPQKKTIKQFLNLVKECQDVESYKQLKLIAYSNISWDKITKISFSENDVYDLTIPNKHNFVSNGIISHNCGKSQAVQDLMKHYKLGEFVTGENSSYAGLIGGMQQTQKRWNIQWGKIALNDRRLVVIDEVSGLHEEDIGRMSGVRSSGVAEITKIQTERTHARTRLIWISNPRSNVGLNSYTFGVDAIKNLIGKPEDIARFDFALTAASEEVGLSEINKLEHEKIEHKYTSDLCRNLILWAWSRKPEDIKFTEAATKIILELATKMGQEYSSKIPLVEGADQRIKLAKLAVATACRVFSTDESGKKIIVQKRHVKFAYDFLERIYSKPSLSYKEFSQQEKDDDNLVKQRHVEILEFLKDNSEIITLFMRYNYLKTNDITDMLDIERASIKSVIKFLSRNRLIKNTSYGYNKTPVFIDLIRKNKSKIMEGLKKEITVEFDGNVPF